MFSQQSFSEHIGYIYFFQKEHNFGRPIIDRMICVKCL